MATVSVTVLGHLISVSQARWAGLCGQVDQVVPEAATPASELENIIWKNHLKSKVALLNTPRITGWIDLVGC